LHTIDLRGVSCPTSFVKAKLGLDTVDPGEAVEFLLDEGEPAGNVPRSLQAEGHRLLGLTERDGYWVLKLEKASSAERNLSEVAEYRSLKITRSGREPAVDPVMVEETIELVINEAKLSTIVTTPGLHKELAVGYLVTEGAVKDRAQIEDVEEKGGRVYVKVRSFERFDGWFELRSSGCVGVNWDKRDDGTFVPVRQVFRAAVLLDGMEYLYDATQDRTGGAHTASLVNSEGKLMYKALDIGRHNAIDKVVGMAVLNGDDLSGMFLVSSGRQPAGMVMKAARAGIPLVISKAAPVSSGIDSARRSNVTLCCFANGEKMKVFSVPERVL
jgi:FdhD protein